MKVNGTSDSQLKSERFAGRISVTLGIGTASYQQTLPEALLRAGMLRRLFRFGINLDALDPDENGSLKLIRRFDFYRQANRVLWGVWRRLPGARRRRLPIVASTWLADRLCADFLPETNIFHSWTAMSLASLRRLKNTRTTTLVENPMLHPQHWQREVLAECKSFGVRPENCDVVLPTALIHRREREFKICNRIIVPSEVARESFEESGYGSKTVVVCPGVDEKLFQPPAIKKEHPIFRVCYVGRIELAKGIPYLIDAWKRLRLANAELVLVGEVRPELQPLFADYERFNIRLLGLVPPKEVPKFYQSSDLFVFPSIHEGMAIALLEAMACGLPAIATITSGAKDCMSHGEDGFVVPVRDADAIAEAISWCYQHPAELRAMGVSARKKIESRFTLEHYVDRQMALYRSLASACGNGPNGVAQPMDRQSSSIAH